MEWTGLAGMDRGGCSGGDRRGVAGEAGEERLGPEGNRQEWNGRSGEGRIGSERNGWMGREWIGEEVEEAECSGVAGEDEIDITKQMII